MFSRFILVATVLLAGCMTYRNFPLDKQTPLSQQKRPVSLSYKIEGNSLFAGPNAIRNVLTSEAAFSSTSPAEKEETRGYYLSVNIKQLSPSVPAVVFGYISVSTLTLLPFWSTNDGAVLTFTLYRDRQKKTSKEYVINRNTFIWAPMILVAWINLSNPSEEQAFAAATRDFITAAFP